MPTTHASLHRFFPLAALLLLSAGAYAAGTLAFAPTFLNFGSNALGEVKTLTTTLKNGTAAAVPLNPATLANNPGGYVIASTTCGASLAAGRSCKYTLRYTAKTLKPAASRLELTTLDPAYPLLKLPLQSNRYPALNDTGITRCGSSTQNGLSCPVPNFPRQDAEYGRDKTRNVASNGRAGFNFTKLDSRGKALPASAQSWDCVRDNVTGLVWEKKPIGDGTIGNQGLHDADDKYTWYSTDSSNNGGTPGEPNPDGNTCFGYMAGQPVTHCNTEAYVSRVNAVGWCGFRDWRLPDRFELLGLVDLNVPYPGPTIDTVYFPDLTLKDPLNPYLYWSSSAHFSETDYALRISFGSGSSNYDGRHYNIGVRLVRVGQ